VKVAKGAPTSGSPWGWMIGTVLLAAAAWVVWARGGAGGDPEVVWKESEDAFRVGRIEQAEAGLARLARLRAPTTRDHLLSAQISMFRRRDDDALAQLARVPDSDPMAAQARLLAGQLELRRDRAAKAEVFLREAIRLDPNIVQAHRELLYIYGLQSRRPELSREFRALSQISNLTFDNVWHWCLTRNTSWEPKEIVEYLGRWIEADGLDKWSRVARADAQRRIGQFTPAMATLEPLGPNDPDARAVRARIALDRGDDEAAAAYLADGPDSNPEIGRMRGRMALARRDGKSAVAHFRAAYEAERDHRDTIVGLSQALAMASDPAGASKFAALARDYDALGSLVQRASTPSGRNDHALWRALGAACEKVERYPEARAWYNLAVEADVADAESQRALFRLKSKLDAADVRPEPGDEAQSRSANRPHAEP
jgi:tetratricopeptide (TPR) repeat protein